MLPQLDAPCPLTREQIAAYQHDGHVLLRGVLSADEVAAFRPEILKHTRAHIDAARPMEQRDTYGKAFLQVMHLWERDAEVAKLSLSRRLGGIVARLMGARAARIYHDQVLLKEPGGGPTPWHQDQYYIPLDTDGVLTMWLPLVDVSPAMGTMRFASGSQRRGMLFDKPTSDATEAFFGEMIAREGWRVTEPPEMEAGDATFHAGWTIHSAPGNSTNRMREVWNVVYFADGARVVERGAWKGAVAAHLKGLKVGDVAASEGNPVVYEDAPGPAGRR